MVADTVLTGQSSSYFVTNASGKFKASLVSANPAGFTFLKIGEPVDAQNKISFTLPTLGDLSKMKAGQKIIILGDVISSFIFDGDKNIKIAMNRANAGGLVLNLEGEVLGLSLFNEVNPFVSIDSINEALKAAPAQ